MDHYIVRKHYRNGYKYYNKQGREIKIDKKLQEFVSKNYIPPAYKDVKINLKSTADVYAIGIDEKGRKQYLYRKKHTENSSKQKFYKLIEFGKIYSSLKRDISILLSKPNNSKEHEIGMILKLMIDCNFRVGNSIYQKENRSFGTTTLQGRHIQKTKNGVSITFTGKKGVENTAKVKDSRLVKSLKKIKNSRKNIFSVDSVEVNQYLKKYGDFSSKDIRTWRANILFIKNVCKFHTATCKPKDTIKQASEKTAELLHHTPSISKKSYIFKELINAYLEQPTKFIHYFSKQPEKQFISFLKKNL
jgi:DNA topoisomerase-1